MTVYSQRKGREQEESLEHLERWEPIETDINCRTCGLTCNQKLNEYSLLTNYTRIPSMTHLELTMTPKSLLLFYSDTMLVRHFLASTSVRLLYDSIKYKLKYKHDPVT